MPTEIETELPGPGYGQWYVFDCGCVVHQIMTLVNYSGKGRICTECHKSKMINKILICPDCKKAFIIGVSARKKKRCTACAKIHKATRRHPKNNSSKTSEISAAGLDRKQKSKIYCEHYEECLDFACKNNKRFLPCDDCKRYKFKAMRLNDDNKSNSISIASNPFARRVSTNWRT